MTQPHIYKIKDFAVFFQLLFILQKVRYNQQFLEYMSDTKSYIELNSSRQELEKYVKESEVECAKFVVEICFVA